MFLHDYPLACEISMVGKLALKFGSLPSIFHRLRDNHVKTLNVKFYYRILINHLDIDV